MLSGPDPGIITFEISYRIKYYTDIMTYLYGFKYLCIPKLILTHIRGKWT